MRMFKRLPNHRPHRDIPGRDVYTNSMIMVGWRTNTIRSRNSTPAVITGKPIALGGSLGREDATARGGCYVVRYLATQIGSILGRGSP